MARPLPVALLGCGALAEILARRVYPAARDHVEVVAAVDVRPERAERLAGMLGARPFGSLEDAVATVDVAAVDVRLPHHLHLEGARLATAAGLPFLMEKPMATSVDDARRIEELGRSTGPSSGVSENYGFLEPVRAARRLVDEGAIGDLLTVQATRVFELGEEWRRDGWRLTSSGAAGVIVDQATHVARLLRTVVGEIVQVHALASARRDGWAGPDSASVACLFESGVTGTQTYCWACPTPAAPDATPELSLYGSSGSIAVYVSYEGDGGGAVLQRPGREDEWHGAGTTYYDSLTAVLVDWAAAVADGREPVASLGEGVRDVMVMQAVLTSSSGEGTVRIETG
jgi:predicted dehydrogenase